MFNSSSVSSSSVSSSPSLRFRTIATTTLSRTRTRTRTRTTRTRFVTRDFFDEKCRDDDDDDDDDDWAVTTQKHHHRLAHRRGRRLRRTISTACERRGNRSGSGMHFSSSSEVRLFGSCFVVHPPTTNDDRGRRTRRRIRRNEHKKALQIATALLKESDDSTNEKEEMMTTSSSSLSSSGTAAKEISTVYGIPRDTVLTPLAGLLLSQLVLYIGVGVLLPALPLYAQSIGLSQSANGLVISAPALAMLILNVPTGQMADRYGRKPVMLTGLGIMAVADIGTAVAKSMLFLIPTRLFLGVGRAACESGDRAYLADLTKRVPEKRGIITAAQAMVHGFGLVIGPLIGGSALDEYGPATAFYVVALAAVGTGIGYAFLPETLSESERSTDEDFFSSADDNDGDANDTTSNMPSFLKFLNLKNMAKSDKKSNVRELLKDPDQRLLLTCAAANSFGFVAKLTVIPLFASGHLNATSLEVGELFSITALLGLATAPVSGLLSDAFGKRWVLTGSLALCAFGLVVASGSEDLEHLRFAVGFWGVGCAAAGPAVNALAQELAPKGGEGESLTLPKTAADIVFLIGPVILGSANDFSDSESAGILITAAIAGVASIVCAYGAATHKKIQGVSAE